MAGNFVGCIIFRSLQKFAGPLFISLTFCFLQTLHFLCPPLISLSFCSNHLIGPIISQDLSIAAPPPPPPPPPPSHFFSFSGVSMAKTLGGSAFRPRMRRSSPPLAGDSSAAPPSASAKPIADPPAAAAPADAPPATVVAAPTVVVSSAAAPALWRYHTRVGPTPLSLPHPRPARRAPPFKRVRTSGLRESPSSRPQEPQSPSHQGPAGAPPLDLSLASIIRWPLFHCNPIPGNVDCSERDLHDEVYYDFPSFSTDPKLRDSMRLVQRYSLELFMTPR